MHVLRNSSLICRYTIVFIYYAFCLVLMMLLRPFLVKKIACGLGKSDRFKSIYAALYFFPVLTVLQAVGGGLLCEFSPVTTKKPTSKHTDKWCMAERGGTR